MGTLKVGDRVRVVSFEGGAKSKLIGECGVITGTATQYDWRVQPDDEADESWLFNTSELELLGTPKFKVGDRVRVVSASDPCGERFIGKVGVVEVDHGGHYDCNLRFDDGATLWFHARDLEPAPPAAAFAVGDRVRITGRGQQSGYARRHVGTVETIARVGNVYPNFGERWYGLSDRPGYGDAWESDLEPFTEETTMGTQIATIDTAELKAMEAVVAATMLPSNHPGLSGWGTGNAMPALVVNDHRLDASRVCGQVGGSYPADDFTALADALEHFFRTTSVERQREIRDGTTGVEVWKVGKVDGCRLVSSNDGGSYDPITYYMGMVVPLCVGFDTEARARDYARAMSNRSHEYQVWRSTCERTEDCPDDLNTGTPGARSCHNLRIIERVATYRDGAVVSYEPAKPEPEPAKCSECGGTLMTATPCDMCAPCAATKEFNDRGERIKAQIGPLLNDATIEVHMCDEPEARGLKGTLGDAAYAPGGAWAPSKAAGQWFAIEHYVASGTRGLARRPDDGLVVHLGNIDGVRVAAREVPIEA